MPLVPKNKNIDSGVDQSMHFWGVCCESGKQYAQVVGQRFRITMAVLDPKSSSKDVDEKTVSLIVIRGGIEYLLCVLKHEEIHQVNLNLIFDKGENVVFYINGHGKVYLSGYQLTDSESDVLNDEIGYLCPLVEVKSPKSKTERKGKASKTPQMIESESVPPKSKKAKEVKKDSVSSDERRPVRGVFNSSVNKKKRDGEIQILNLDSDDSDEDFDVGDEESESENEDDLEEYLDAEELRGQGISDLKTYIDNDDDDEEEEDDDDDEDDEEEEEQEQQVILDSKGSQKRKLTNALQPQKRSRNDSFMSTPTTTKQSEDLCDEDSSDSEPMNSSVGNTPMPKKQKNIETCSEKKKSNKKKRLSEISILSEKLGKSPLKSAVAESTPNRPENSPGKYPVQKLESGVEIQDVIVGRGPVAAKGKMAHVFYVGRLQDKTIFDSRIPGKKPFSFKLGSQQVIKGLEIGVQGMNVGGKRKLKIPPSLGYGKEARGVIPSNSTLFFVVELQAVS